MLYATVSSTRADVRVPDTETLTLVYANAMPASLVTAKKSGQASRRTEASPAGEAPADANGKHFTEYLQLHRTRTDAGM